MNDIQALSQSGRYIKPRLLGYGATANVYGAQNAGTGKKVAIKVLHSSLTQDTISLERFKREIQIARLVNHPGMVPIYDMVRIKGRVCLEMELLQGVTLKEYIQAKGRLSVDLAMKITIKLAHILMACHKKNIIHRDLKPQNVFLSKDGRVRLLDFGIAKMTMLNDLTKSGVSLGTPEYMAPELFAGSCSDPRTDIYSLGVIAFELITGRPPFQGDSIAVLFNEHIRTPVPDIWEYNRKTPLWIKAAIGKLLEKNPVNRYQCVDELMLDLRQKNVASKSMPGLEKTICINCGKEAIKHLPFCVFCGFGFSKAARDGRFRLTRKIEYRNFMVPKTEKEELRRFANQTFDLDLKKVPANRKVFLSGVDKMFAELVQKKAEKHRIFLELKEIDSVRDAFTEILRMLALLPILSLYMFLIVFFINITWEGSIKVNSPLFIMAVLFSVMVVALVSAISAIAIIRIGLKPMLDKKDLFSTWFFQDLKWLHKMSESLQKSRTDEMRQVVAQTFEQLLLLQGQSEDIPGQNFEMERMQQLLLISVNVANLVSEVDDNLAKVDWAGMNVDYLTAKAKGGDMFYMELLDQYQGLQEKRDALMIRFFEMRFILNRLCAHTLVMKQTLKQDMLEDYENSLKSLEKDLSILAEVRIEVTSL